MAGRMEEVDKQILSLLIVRYEINKEDTVNRAHLNDVLTAFIEKAMNTDAPSAASKDEAVMGIENKIRSLLKTMTAGVTIEQKITLAKEETFDRLISAMKALLKDKTNARFDELVDVRAVAGLR